MENIRIMGNVRNKTPDKIWEMMRSKIQSIAKTHEIVLKNNEIEPSSVLDAGSAEGGFTMGRYPGSGFDIRPYGWVSPVNEKTWCKHVRWDAKMGSTPAKREIKTIANRMAKESQKIWDNWCWCHQIQQ